jgi:hypothetical protein
VDENQQQSIPAILQQDSLLDRVQEKSLHIPEPVKKEDQDLPEVVEERIEEVPEVVEQRAEHIPQVVEQVQLPMPETIETTQGFEVRLPPGKLKAILKSIDSTPHEGYKPVVGFTPNGQIIIDWVSV